MTLPSSTPAEHHEHLVAREKREMVPSDTTGKTHSEAAQSSLGLNTRGIDSPIVARGSTTLHPPLLNRRSDKNCTFDDAINILRPCHCMTARHQRFSSVCCTSELEQRNSHGSKCRRDLWCGATSAITEASWTHDYQQDSVRSAHISTMSITAGNTWRTGAASPLSFEYLDRQDFWPNDFLLRKLVCQGHR